MSRGYSGNREAVAARLDEETHNRTSVRPIDDVVRANRPDEK